MSLRYSFSRFVRGWLPDREGPLARSPIRALLAGTLVTVMLSSLLMSSFVTVSRPPPLLPVVQPGRDAEAVVHGGDPTGLAVDQRGTLFWTDEATGQLLSLTPDGTAATVLLEGLHEPQGVALDSAGNLYFAEYATGTLSVLDSGSRIPRIVLEDLNYPTFLTVDSAGNLFFIEGQSIPRLFEAGDPYSRGAPCGLRIVRFDPVPATSTTLMTWAGERGQFRGFCALFADALGNLYYTTGSEGTVERLQLASLSTGVLVSGFEVVRGVFVDARGNVFFVDLRRGVHVLATGADVPTKLSGFGACSGRLAVDAAGNVYYTDMGDAVLKVPASRVISYLGLEKQSLPWPFSLLPGEAIFALAALPAILGTLIAYGRRNYR